jgi:23S rRNA pseudouridine955/2504/2580 synthase
VAGDRRYGDEQFNRKMKDYGLKRMFLHAASLSFPHPDNDKEFKIEPPLDDDLQQVLDNLNR